MTHLFLIISLAFGFAKKNTDSKEALPPENKHQRFELIDYKQFQSPVAKFDLSGLAQYKNTVIAVNDKNDPNIYTVYWQEAKLSSDFKVTTTDKLDFEAIDTCDEDIYISNEKNKLIYKLNSAKETSTIEPDYKGAKIFKSFLDVNVFYEGIALDCKKSILYMFKEREERHILNVDLKTKKISEKWNIPESDSWDFSDAKFDNGYLYVIERGGHLVTKINPQTQMVVAKYSFQNFEKGPGYLFGPALHGQAEALLLTDTEIWIGFDNNGRPATNQAIASYKLKGKSPLIARFKRPKGF